MRIVLLVEELGIGGLPNHVLDLARLLRVAGDTVVVAHGNGAPPPHLETGGTTLLHVPGLADAAGSDAVDAAVCTLAALRPDLVHMHLGSNPMLIERLPRLGVPLLRSFHDYTSLCLRRGRKRWPGDRCGRAVGLGCAAWGCVVAPPLPGRSLPRLMDLSAKIRERDRFRAFHGAVVGSVHMAAVLRHNGFDAATTHTVPYFSRFEAASGRTPARLPGLPGRDRPLEMLFMGQAVKGKGLEVLMAALAGLEGNWRLTVVSDGPRLSAARRMAERDGLGSRLHFVNWAPQGEIGRFYAAADLLVLPSIWDDPGPLVGIEALSHGTPIVGFAVGGIPDYLQHGVTGLLVRQTSPAPLRAALAQVLTAPERLPGWGAAGQALVAARHTGANHLRMLRAAYRQAVARTGMGTDKPRITAEMEAT